MVLESLVRAQTAEDHPLRMFLLGALYAFLGIVIALWVFRSHAGLVSVFFSVIFLIPLFLDTLLKEEYAEIHTQSERRLLLSHARALTYLIWIFAGMTTAYAAGYLLIPDHYINDAYGIQLSTITEFNTDLANSISGGAISVGVFNAILINNLKVLAISFLLTLISGAGVLFVISWNASVIGAALGTYVTQQASAIGGPLAIAPLLGLIRYALHAIPEAAAYFIGGISGGLLSLALVHHNTEHAPSQTLLRDTFYLLFLSCAILVLAALIEVYAVPAILG
ncbi:stage II sporulation protein M [Candidatus Woesearchaeota archaeon]|nr:stage II sporulation protein M [Candidatus Woesearchaeota archaeon]